MDTTTCWEIIERVRVRAGDEWNKLDDRLAEELVDEMVELSSSDIIAFAVCFEALQDRLNRDDLFMAAFLIHNGCGDDSFMDFCAGVVGLGREWYERALADPDDLADHPAVRGVAAGTVNISVLLTERFLFAPLEVYENLATEDEPDFYAAVSDAEQPAPDDLPPVIVPPMPRRLERLAALFPQQQAHLEQFYPHLTGSAPADRK